MGAGQTTGTGRRAPCEWHDVSCTPEVDRDSACPFALTATGTIPRHDRLIQRDESSRATSFPFDDCSRLRAVLVTVIVKPRLNFVLRATGPHSRFLFL